jgi:hypothetical protein
VGTEDVLGLAVFAPVQRNGVAEVAHRGHPRLIVLKFVEGGYNLVHVITL